MKIEDVGTRITTHDGVVEEIKKWIEKCNAMMLASGEGACPQMLRMAMWKIYFDRYEKGIKEFEGNEYQERWDSCYKMADKILNKMCDEHQIKQTGKIKFIDEVKGGKKKK